MRSPVRGGFTAALALGLLVAAVAVAARAPVGAVPSAAVPALRWQACGGPYECARARVPLDHGDPTGPKISIALMRLPASDPARRIGSLFINPGGPGGSGVDVIEAGGAQVIWSAAVRARFDIVGFDPRGVVRSTPIRCFSSNAEAERFFEGHPIFPYTDGQVAPYISLAARFSQRCGREAGPIIGHMSTANVARDLDLLRRAVGDDRLSYDGVSYGSLLGSTYAAMFPNRVRAMVLDGVADPVSWTTGRPPHGATIPMFLRTGSAKGAEVTLKRFTVLCDAAGPAACPLAPGSRAKIDRLQARLRRGPIEIPGQLVTYDLFVDTVLGALYLTGDWAPLSQLLADLHSVAFGSGVPRGSTLSFAPAARALDYDNGIEASLGVMCSDGVNARDPYTWPRSVAYAEAHGAPFFAADFGWISAPCATWPASDPDRYRGPFDRTPSAPILLIGNRFDPATPYAGALAVDDLVPRTRLLTLNGGGHTAWLNQSACIERHRERYLIGGALPPAGTICQPDHQPFAARAGEASRAALRPLVTGR